MWFLWLLLGLLAVPEVSPGGVDKESAVNGHNISTLMQYVYWQGENRIWQKVFIVRSGAFGVES